MTLNEVMKETADAIREKTGKSELIAPVDFAEEIKGISAGGGEVTAEYYLFDAKKNQVLDNETYLDFFALTSSFVQVLYGSNKVIQKTLSQCLSGAMIFFPEENGFVFSNIRAFKVIPIDGGVFFLDVIKQRGWDESMLSVFGLTPCTKEEYEALITA